MPLPLGPRPWRATPLHLGSAVLHGAAAVAALGWTGAWPWALSAVLANHLAAASLTLAPRNRLLGPAISELPPQAGDAVALSFDDGPDPASTPRVLDALDAAGARATFFAVGERVARHPALAREIVARGHDLENHSWSHPVSFGFLAGAALHAQLLRAQHAIADATGVGPVFFRPPFGVRTPWLEPELARLGLHCAVWSLRAYDAVAVDAARVGARLRAGLRRGAIVLLHDAVAVHRRDTPPVALDVLKELLPAMAQRGLRAVSLRQAHGLD